MRREQSLACHRFGVSPSRSINRGVAARLVQPPLNGSTNKRGQAPLPEPGASCPSTPFVSSGTCHLHASATILSSSSPSLPFCTRLVAHEQRRGCKKPPRQRRILAQQWHVEFREDTPSSAGSHGIVGGRLPPDVLALLRFTPAKTRRRSSRNKSFAVVIRLPKSPIESTHDFGKRVMSEDSQEIILHLSITLSPSVSHSRHSGRRDW